MHDVNIGSRFFIALIPPEPIRGMVTGLKNEMLERFNSKGALNAPPHITLLMPFTLKEKKLDSLKSFLAKFSNSVDSFEIKHNGFGCFEPRVIFIDVIENHELHLLQNRLGLEIRKFQVFNKTYKDRVFHPHMTIGFRDLKKPQFYEAWSTFEKRIFDLTWTARGLYLLRHDQKVWQIDQEFLF